MALGFSYLGGKKHKKSCKSSTRKRRSRRHKKSRKMSKGGMMASNTAQATALGLLGLQLLAGKKSMKRGRKRRR